MRGNRAIALIHRHHPLRKRSRRHEQKDRIAQMEKVSAFVKHSGHLKPINSAAYALCVRALFFLKGVFYVIVLLKEQLSSSVLVVIAGKS